MLQFPLGPGHNPIQNRGENRDFGALKAGFSAVVGIDLKLKEDSEGGLKRRCEGKASWRRACSRPGKVPGNSNVKEDSEFPARPLPSPGPRPGNGLPRKPGRWSAGLSSGYLLLLSAPWHGLPSHVARSGPGAFGVRAGPRPFRSVFCPRPWRAEGKVSHATGLPQFGLPREVVISLLVCRILLERG